MVDDKWSTGLVNKTKGRQLAYDEHYKSAIRLYSLPEASLACQEPPVVSPDRQGQLLFDWAFLSLVVTTFDKL